MTATHVLSCREIVELVTEYLEGDLDAQTSTALEVHLELCPGCARYLEQIRETVAALGEFSSDNLSSEVQAACRRHSVNFVARRPAGSATPEAGLLRSPLMTLTERSPNAVVPRRTLPASRWQQQADRRPPRHRAPVAGR